MDLRSTNQPTDNNQSPDSQQEALEQEAIKLKAALLSLKQSTGWAVMLNYLQLEQNDYYNVVLDSNKANERISAADKLKMVRLFAMLPEIIMAKTTGVDPVDVQW